MDLLAIKVGLKRANPKPKDKMQADPSRHGQVAMHQYLVLVREL